MNIAVSGSQGFIGSALVGSLQAAGHQVTPLVRGRSSIAGGIAWSSEAAYVDTAKLEGIDAVVHLAGESI
ncbi:MAG: NAD-dependent epimerase/dehydratase family protein, partial [Terriglobia bacterium]